MEETNPEVIVCEICGTYSGSKAQLRGHRMQCRIKSEQPLKMKTPQELQAELDAAQAQIAALQTPKEIASGPEPRRREEPNRKERIPISVRRKRLQGADDPRFHRRVFNDNWRKAPRRITEALEGGYAPVPGHEPKPVGSNDDGTAVMGHLMQIPIELYNQDQAAKQKVLDSRDKAMREGTFGIAPADREFITSKTTTDTRLSRAFDDSPTDAEEN